MYKKGFGVIFKSMLSSSESVSVRRGDTKMSLKSIPVRICRVPLADRHVITIYDTKVKGWG